MPTLTRRDFLRLSALTALASPLLLNARTLNHAAALTPTPTATLLPPPAKPIRGLFAVMPRNEDAIPAEVLASPFIAGITVQINWSTLQPTQKDFAWDVLDSVISRASAAGKKVALKPLAGVGSPAWLYRAGVKKFTFVPESDMYHPLEFGKPTSLPYPWDKALITAWSAFVQALGQRFDYDPTLVRVGVSGPMYQQAETYLPHDEAVLTDWVQNGYFLTVMQSVWQKMLDVYAQAFPRTPFTLDLNPMLDAIDKKGGTFSGLVPIAIAQYGLRRYPGRFFPAQSDLSDVYPWLPGPAKQPALYLSYERQLVPIYQYLTTAAQTFGVLISESRLSRTANRIRAALERAVQLKATYIEIPAAWVSDPANANALRGLFETRAG
jgi:hypothetical protein